MGINLTNSERKQPNKIFVEAGKKAFKMKVEFRDNPYRERPYKTLWEKGFMSEKRFYNNNRRRQSAVAGA